MDPPAELSRYSEPRALKRETHQLCRLSAFALLRPNDEAESLGSSTTVERRTDSATYSYFIFPRPANHEYPDGSSPLEKHRHPKRRPRPKPPASMLLRHFVGASRVGESLAGPIG